MIQLGTPFMRQYVTSFNYEDKSITLGLNAKKPGTSSGSSFILMAVLGVGAVAVIGGAVFLFLRRRKKQRLAVSDDYKKNQDNNPLASSLLTDSMVRNSQYSK